MNLISNLDMNFLTKNLAEEQKIKPHPVNIFKNTNQTIIGYKTKKGSCICGDSLELIKMLDDGSVDLFITSPPFALQRKKEYGNADQNEYVDWFCSYAESIYVKLKDTGSFVVDIGGAYKSGVPEYSLYQFKILLNYCEKYNFKLAQPFYWHNSSALPAPIEWVNKRKLRAKTSVNTLWWFCKDSFCKANISNVLIPYSDRMKKLMKCPNDFIKEEGVQRPSGHIMGMSSWTRDNGGAIPPNMLQIPNSESNSKYLKLCKDLQIKGHPARFPKALPEFFIKFLTERDDFVVDIFSGSNTTGEVCEELGRRWMSFELSKEYVANSSLRFADDNKIAYNYYNKILKDDFVELKYESNLLDI